MTYVVKYNKSTNHIDGIGSRSAGEGEERGGVVGYYAQNACSSLTRYTFADGSSHEVLSKALEAARKGDRKLCKTCEKAAEAQIAAEAEQMNQPPHREEADAPSASIPEVTTDNEENPVMATKKPAATPETTSDADVDALVSDVHATIDQLKAIDPKSDGAHSAVTELSQEAEKKILELPTAKRNTLRSAVKEAREAQYDAIKGDAPAAVVVRTVSGTVVSAEDHNKIDGVPKLIKDAEKSLKAGIQHGVKAGSTAEDVARIIVNIRSKIVNPANGLPDLTAIGKTPKNAAGEVYSNIKKTISEDDSLQVTAFNSVQKAASNKMSDVLVDWIRAMDTPESAEVFNDLFPEAAQAIAKRAQVIADMEADENEYAEGDIPPVLTPSEALYDLYAEKGVTLPRKGRTELERENKTLKAITAAQVRLEAVKETLETDAANDDAQAEKDKLEARVEELTAKLPADVVVKPVPLKTAGEKAVDKFEKAKALVTAGTKNASKLDAAEKAALKAKIDALVTILAGESAKLA
ncbi:hypothetical protein [Streptomyces lavendulae]|uniref:hypothetical protein n=1 Tax=Streptomyces lavendulae TaxID=1914 RepID=UPI00367E543C